eukprot:9489773-Pyramimonas_sp.AAC.1
MEADRLRPQDWKAHTLRPPEEAAAFRRDLGLTQPYIGPKLRHPATDGEFISELLGMGHAAPLPCSRPPRAPQGLRGREK